MTTSNGVTRTVDLTPSKAFEAAIFIEVLKNPDASPEGIKDATEGLMNLARACDKAATCEPDLILDAGQAVKDLTDYIREVADLDDLARAYSRTLTDRAVIVTQVGEPDDWVEDLESNAYKSGKQVDYKALAASQTAKDRELHHNEFNLDVRVTDKQVLHLLTDAIDTGHSSYWFTISGYNFPEGVTREDFREGGRLSAPASAGGNYFHPDELIPFVGEIVVTDSESGESLGVLNRETMAKGLRLMAENYPAHWANFWGGRGDAETGDVWLQLAVMGKLIYG